MAKKKVIDVDDLRESLQALIFKELENLPETLAELEPMQRLNIVCKLLPFVMPKIGATDPNKFNPFSL